MRDSCQKDKPIQNNNFGTVSKITEQKFESVQNGSTNVTAPLSEQEKLLIIKKQKRKAYNQKNKERDSIRGKKYYLKNKRRIIRRIKEYHLKNEKQRSVYCKKMETR